MPRPIYITIDPANVDDDGIAASQTPSGAGAVTLNGALGTTLDYARQLGIYSGSDISNRTFVVTGTDAMGNTITENVTGPNNTTVETTKYYKAITSITISGAAAGAIIIGTVDELATGYIILDHYSQVAAQVAINITGTINFTVQETFESPHANASPNWLNVTALASKTADTNSQVSVGARACRVIVNSYTDTAEFGIAVIQAHN